MSCIQTGVCWPNTRSERACLPLSQSSDLRSSYPNTSSTLKLQHHRSLLHFACHAYRAPKYKRSAPICAFGGKGNSESKNEPFSWDSLKKAMEGFKKEPSVQDLLRKQMKEQNFDGDGGGTSPPGGNGDGSGGQEDEGFAGIWDETLQVVLATIAFIFVNYVGVIDGTHIHASIPADIVARFRGRKDHPTQNVLTAINFDLRFTYVLAGWEGSVYNAKVFNDALERPNGLRVSEGYSTRPRFITPYRGVRYHLKDYGDHTPKNAKELFNWIHSFVRTTVERAFGALKN